MAKGFKSGGRKPGSKNKKTLDAEAALARAIAESGAVDPLEFMLAVMRDPQADFRVRLEAAKSAAPYRHARLSAIDHRGRAGVTVLLAGDDLALL